MDQLRRTTTWYIGALVVATAVLLISLSPYAVMPRGERLILAGMLVVLGMAAAAFPLHTGAGIKVSLHTSVLFAATLLFEPVVAMLIAGSGLLLMQSIHQDPWDQTVFNTAQLMLQVGVGGSLLLAAGWNFNAIAFDRPYIVVVLALVAVLMYVIECSSVATIIGLHEGRSPLHVARHVVRLDIELLAQFTLGLLGALIAHKSIWALPLMIPPFWVLYRSSQQQLQLQHQAKLLEHQAFHDSLTELPNRALFMDRVQQALHRAARSQHMLAVLFVDLDRFKYVNDSLGHEAGDQLLVAVAQRLVECVRPEDTVARLGGDEFTILLEDMHYVHQATMVAERIKCAFHAPFVIKQQHIFMSASIGITLGEASSCQPSQLIVNADAAMYKAKEKGGSSYEVFDVQMDSRSLARLQLETELYQALERDEFVVFYQPLVNLITGDITCFEALVRWKHPLRGFVSPAQFIPLAEETGLILPLGRLVLRHACHQLQQWLAYAPINHPLTISVNLSARQFEHPALVEEIRQILEETQLDPHRLRLEITESTMMHHASSALGILQNLKQLGVQLAIDDFGTGYSSLSYLKHFPIDTLKIDQSFVRRLSHDAADVAIVQAIITLARTLEMQTVAEGIETVEQQKLLQMLGCGIGQGYLFARPLPSDDADELLEIGIPLASNALAVSA